MTWRLAWAVVCASASSAAAFSDPELFSAPAEQGGGGGRQFTGSRLDGFTCSVCHSGGAEPDVVIEGLPVSLASDETYRVVIRFAKPETSYALQLEVLHESGASLALQLPPSDTVTSVGRCDGESTGDVAAYRRDLGDRVILGTQDCGAREMRVSMVAAASAHSKKRDRRGTHLGKHSCRDAQTLCRSRC